MTDSGVPPGPIMCICRCERHSIPPQDRRRPVLSQQELKVARIWLRCDSKGAVAARLSISHNTVRTHIGRVRAKYLAAGRPVPTKTHLLIRALSDGLVNLAELERDIDADVAESAPR